MSQNSLFLSHERFELADETGKDLSRQAEIAQIIGALASGKLTFHTSGTTAQPKSIVHSTELLRKSTLRSIRYFDLPSGSKVYCPLSPSFTGGKMAVVRALFTGHQLLLSKASSNLRLPVGRRFDFGIMVPVQLAWLMNNARETLLNSGFEKGILLGGGTLGEALEEQAASLPFPVYHGYGMTETASHVALRQVGMAETYVAMEGVEFLLDERGCLHICDQMLGLDIQTNDMAHLISNKEMRWLGRFDNVIISGGKNISPEQWEKTIAAYLPNGTNYFIAGLPNEEWGETPTLFLEGKWDTLAEVEEKIRKKTEQTILKTVALEKFYVRRAEKSIERPPWQTFWDIWIKSYRILIYSIKR